MRRAVAVAAACFTLVAAFACGDVPTLPGGVAYISPILLPSPSVAFGDTLRDSLGRATPLRVFALGRGAADTIRAITVRFLLTTLNSGASLGGDGFLIAPDTLTSLRVVAQVIDAGGTLLQLQTPEVTIDVVPLADSIVRAASGPDTATSRLPLLDPLAVSVTGTGPHGIRGPVGGIRVRYRIAAVYPASATAARAQLYLWDDAFKVLHPDSTIAIDTTTSGGVASRALVGPAAPAGSANADSIVVEASALSQKGIPLAGSPVRFTIRIRK